MNQHRPTLEQAPIHSPINRFHQSTRMAIVSRIPKVLLVVALVTLNWQQTVRANCVPTLTKPDLDSIHVKNVASFYRGVVANMAGYLELYNSPDNSSYLPLNIKSISVSQADFFGARMITFADECFTFDIGYSIKAAVHPSKYTYDFYGIDHMFIKNDANQDKSPKEICNFDQIFDLRLPYDSRYSCKEVLSHQCSFARQPIASLVLKSFEIDLDGYPANVKKGLFTGSPLKDSCTHWNK